MWFGEIIVELERWIWGRLFINGFKDYENEEIEDKFY